MKKRDLETNDILTNVYFEFSVKGKDSLNTLVQQAMELGNQSDSTARLVGLSLKKPTARFSIIKDVKINCDEVLATPSSIENALYDESSEAVDDSLDNEDEVNEIESEVASNDEESD